ncbi:hypothetical protein [Enterococcus sp. BWR-S5]|uniref:hypothetical protein n=1 Tax=Enterococcus sp. BWR-S5 TaxID=2787714 RepID=UPI00192400C9|nr:hypothetical protein [Enterococcus sp. BWR-S5]MBL1226912.1 hypothetical protein [Enterococcus sp. BWR-S5]
MAVKIDKISGLQEMSSTLTSYSQTITDATQDASTKLSAKIEGQQADALNAYLEIINDMSSKVYVEYPQQITLFARKLDIYHGAVTGEGFSTKVRSSVPGVEDDYCDKLVKREEKLTGQIDEMKKVIDEILADSDAAAAITSDPATTISSKKDAFQTDVDTCVTAIKKTRSNLQEAVDTFKSDLEGVKETLSGLKSSIETVSMITDPKNGLSASTAVALIASGKMDAGSIPGFLNGIKKENDAKALEYLLNEDYKSYFELDATKIGDVPSALLVKQLADITNMPAETMNEIEQKKLQSILNHLMGLNSEAAIEAHLQNMLNASDVLSLQYAAILATKSEDLGYEMTEVERQKLLEQFEKMNALGSLWMTLYAAETPAGTSTKEYGHHTAKGEETLRFSLDGLTLSAGGQFSFGIKQNSTIKANGQVYEGEKIQSYNSLFHENYSATSAAGESRKLAEIQEQRQAYLEELLKNGLITTIGVFNPAVGTGLLFLDALATQNTTSLLRGNDVAKNMMDKNADYYKGLTKVTDNSVKYLKLIIDYQKNMSGADKKTAAAEEDIMSAIIGKGGREGNLILGDNGQKTIAFEDGMPTVESIARLNELNNCGLTNYPYPGEQSLVERAKDGYALNGVNNLNELPPAQKYLLNIGGYSLGDEGCSPSEVRAALNDIASKTGLKSSDFFDYIEDIGK